MAYLCCFIEPNNQSADLKERAFPKRNKIRTKTIEISGLKINENQSSLIKFKYEKHWKSRFFLSA
jgi:hypothetical protein